MGNKCVQMSMYDTYKHVAANMEDDKPKLFRQLDEHIDFLICIPLHIWPFPLRLPSLFWT